MHVLKDLWRGNISPAERCVRPGSEYAGVSKQLSTQFGELLPLLSPEARQQVETVDNLRTDLCLMENEEHFLYGFRLGAQLMLDIFSDCPGQFCSVTGAD